jgi:hemolysin activation/secretion protein
VPLPPYLSPLLGGIANLRGFKAGTEAGDTLVGSSAELRLPLSSPLRIGRFGVSAFMDLATVYDKGQQVTDQHFERGVGLGVWLSATFLRLQLYVAHGVGGSTRVHFGTAVLF